MAIRIQMPLTREQARTLKAGDSCLISGVIYTARRRPQAAVRPGGGGQGAASAH